MHRIPLLTAYILYFSTFTYTYRWDMPTLPTSPIDCAFCLVPTVISACAGLVALGWLTLILKERTHAHRTRTQAR